MTTVNEPVRRRHEPPRWMVRTRRVLDILATGGTILWTEPPKPRHPKNSLTTRSVAEATGEAEKTETPNDEGAPNRATVDKTAARVHRHGS